ncbi:uncharacterized protein LOC124940593 isoform X1 [Impatiens glandulifera]|uniref:uncharacterized protein LOC124940593 isoform X1 n=2 Tax=Impatiens glandulifera TaxID=253017 RepID=UPI001FB0E9AC|nr:uncharacterized protein LOC124940593 isoform X1 [Impatiens glandulifera]
MAATTMASAAGAVVLLYFVLNRRLAAASKAEEEENEHSKSSRSPPLRRRISRRPAQAPATWFEAITTLSDTLRYTYSETLGKWPIGDLAFGINYLMRRQGNLQVASVYAGEGCVQLNGPEMVAELNCYLRFLTLCMLFSKKSFSVFLESAGYTDADVLLQKPKAGLLKPAFTILRDEGSKCFILLIRGTHSIKDTLTAATGAVVPFHHSVLGDGEINNLVLGYAHSGMTAAAQWIAKISIPCLLKALAEYPDYKVKIVGHSLGGGTAALLTYILREKNQFSLTTCVSFAPAACMTWNLAESGEQFITTVINGSDIVPTFSASSLDDLRSEVTASSWLNDLRAQVERTRVLNVVYRSATALGSRLPSIASAKAKVAGASALLRPVSSGTQVVIKRAQNVAQAVVKTRSSFSAWSCMGARRRTVSTVVSNSEGEEISSALLITEPTSQILESEDLTRNLLHNNNKQRVSYSSSGGSGHDDTDEDENAPVNAETIVDATAAASSSSATAIVEMTEGEYEIWYEVGSKLDENRKELVEGGEESKTESSVRVEEEQVVVVVESHRFYPPGRIMHIVCACEDGNGGESGGNIGIYGTPRELYSKIRLSKTMINDHYMPMYKKMIEGLLRDLDKNEEQQEQEKVSYEEDMI